MVPLPRPCSLGPARYSRFSRTQAAHKADAGLATASGGADWPGTADDLQLFLEKLLRARNVLDPGKAVLLADIAEPLSVHASRQPFPAIDADVHVKREPGLNPRMHPAKFRIDAVMINRQTGTGPDHHVRFVVLECGSHLHTAQSAHIPFGNASFGSEGARDLLFVVLAVDVLHQQILLLKRRQCRLLDLLTDL